MKTLNRINKQQAFTLIELMVGAVLGLLLIAAAGTIYLSSSKTNRTSQGLLNAKSDIQLAIGVLKEDLSRAGWANNTSASYTLPSPLPTDFATYDGGANSDIIKVHYESCDNTDAANKCTAANLESVDCNGVAVAGGNIITNSYSVNANKELICNGQPLISNVENFQVLYGQVTPNGIQYVTANNITNSSQIHSIRFGLIVSSDIDTADKNISRSIDLLDQTITSNDRKVRLKYESTVVVLNKPFTSNFGI